MKATNATLGRKTCLRLRALPTLQRRLTLCTSKSSCRFPLFGRRFMSLDGCQSESEGKYIFLDFDGTLTTHDTTPNIFNIYMKSLKPECLQSDLQQRWKRYSEEYVSKYSTAFQKATSIPNGSLEQSLKIIDQFELKSVRDLETSKIFEGLGMGQAALEMEAALVQLRSGAIELLELATRDSRTKTAIISVSWSARFIREVLNQVDGLVPLMDRITIIANEFETNDVGATTGKIRGGIHTGQQKLSAMIQFLNQHQDQSESLPLHRSPHIIYVGDSVLDLPCIMASKSGFLLQPQLGMGSAQTLCDNAGIKTQSLHTNKAISGNEKENKVVIVVQSLDHVVAALRDSSR